MGWLFSPRWATRADLVQHLRRPERFGDRLQLVRACVTGSHHWYLVRELATGQHWIGLDLMQSGRAACRARRVRRAVARAGPGISRRPPGKARAGGRCLGVLWWPGVPAAAPGRSAPWVACGRRARPGLPHAGPPGRPGKARTWPRRGCLIRPTRPPSPPWWRAFCLCLLTCCAQFIF